MLYKIRIYAGEAEVNTIPGLFFKIEKAYS